MLLPELLLTDSRVLSTEVLEQAIPENRFYGWWVVCDASGQKLQASHAGQDFPLIWLRSTFKPFQAWPLLSSGVYKTLPAPIRAVICSSHSATAEHQHWVNKVLALAQCDLEHLHCGSHWPLDDAARTAAKSLHEKALPLFHNCSGKHAGMLLACRVNKWPIEHYLSPSHPLQQAIASHLRAELQPTSIAWGVDGCSAPVPCIPMPQLAMLYARLVSQPVYAPVFQAVSQHPVLAGGPDRIDTLLMQASKGELFCKVGADGLMAVGHQPSGYGLALKLACGTEWARNKLIPHLLARLGWLRAEQAHRLAPLEKTNARGSITSVLQL